MTAGRTTTTTSNDLAKWGQHAVWFLSGTTVALGIGLGGMTHRTAHAFFDLSFSGRYGPFNFNLPVVFACGLVIPTVTYQLLGLPKKPLFGDIFHIPTSKVIDAQLIGGSVLFAVGWAIAGYCPGSGVVGVPTGQSQFVLYTLGMLEGMVMMHWWNMYRSGCAARADDSPDSSNHTASKPLWRQATAFSLNPGATLTRATSTSALGANSWRLALAPLILGLFPFIGLRTPGSMVSSVIPWSTVARPELLEQWPLLYSAIGGLLVGTASTTLLLGVGRIMGVSGIMSGTVSPNPITTKTTNFAFMAGMLLGGTILAYTIPEAFALYDYSGFYNAPMMVLSGIIGGAGVSLACGCTSGHGIAGISRLSIRSMVAVGTFMAAMFAFVTTTGLIDPDRTLRIF